MIIVGVDIGSTTAKAVVLNESATVWSAIIPSGNSPPSAGKEVFALAVENSRHTMEEVSCVIATGYGRVSAEFANKTVTEISCHARGANYLNPATRTIIDIGGQDSKAISLDEHGKVIDFMINDKCASGTGRFLETAAELVLRVKLQDLGALSAKATDTPNISSACTVFAQTEMVSLLATGVSVENLIAGLHRAIAIKVSGMVKRIGIKPTVMMTGGVAKNSGVIAAFRKELNIDVVVPTNIDPQLVGALGAALIAQEMAKNGGTGRV